MNSFLRQRQSLPPAEETDKNPALFPPAPAETLAENRSSPDEGGGCWRNQQREQVGFLLGKAAEQ